MGNDFRYTSVVLDNGSFGTNLAANHATPQETPGIERRIMTKYGPAAVRYGKCTQSGGCTRGELQKKKAVASINNISSGTTTTIVTTGLTANEYDYDLLVCLDDAGGAGASPEGYVSPIVSNNTTTVYLDPDNPFPVATAANDDFRVVSFCKTADSAAGDEVSDLFGVAATSISEGYWGWFFFDGICPYTLIRASTGLTAARALIAHTARVDVSSTSADQLLIGQVLGKLAVTSDVVDDVCAVELYNLGHARSVSA